MHFFLFTTKEDALKPLDKVITDARWVAINEVVKLLTNQKDREFFLSIKEKIAF